MRKLWSASNVKIYGGLSKVSYLDELSRPTGSTTTSTFSSATANR
jgi:hypothetical protein